MMMMFSRHLLKALFFPNFVMLFREILVDGVSQNFCAEFKAIEAGGATGYFAAIIDESTAKYTYDLELSQLSTSCDLSKGLYYHIHNYWTLSSKVSAEGDSCLTTGYHYDPNFACSKPTQICEALNRTSSKSYEYACNPTSYSEGYYGLCEVGDLSGKFGMANQRVSPFPTGSIRFKRDTFHVDNQPPYLSNYNQDTPISTKWSSIVFHCGVDKKPLVCARFKVVSETESSVCNFPTLTQLYYSGNQFGTRTLGGEATALVIISVFFILYVLVTSILFCKYRYCSRRNNSGRQNEEDQNVGLTM